MLTTFRTVDIWILEKVVEPFSWTIESFTNFSNFRQARVTLLAFFVSSYGLNTSGSSLSVVELISMVFAVVLLYFHSKWLEKTRNSGTLSIARTAWYHVHGRLMGWALVFVLLLLTIAMLERSDETGYRKVEFLRSESDLWFNLFLLYVYPLSALLYSYFLACSSMPAKYERHLSSKEVYSS